MRDGVTAPAVGRARSEPAVARRQHRADGDRALAGCPAAGLHAGRRGRRLADRPRPRSHVAARISPIASAGCAFRAWPGRGTTAGSSIRAIPSRPPGKTYEAALSDHALYYHRIGTPQSDDQLIFARPDLPTWFVHGTVSEDGRYLLIALFEGATNSNRLYVADLGDPASPDVRAPIRAVVEDRRRRVRADRGRAGNAVRALGCSGAEPVRARARSRADDHRRGGWSSPSARIGSVRWCWPADGWWPNHSSMCRAASTSSISGPAPPSARLALPAPGVVTALDGRSADRRRVADVHVAAPPGHCLSQRTSPAATLSAFEPASAPVDLSALRDPPDVRVLPRRHPGAVLRHRPGDAAARRRHARDDVRLRRILGGSCCRPTGRTCRRGSSAAACGSP